MVKMFNSRCPFLWIICTDSKLRWENLWKGQASIADKCGNFREEVARRKFLLKESLYEVWHKACSKHSWSGVTKNSLLWPECKMWCMLRILTLFVTLNAPWWHWDMVVAALCLMFLNRVWYTAILVKKKMAQLKSRPTSTLDSVMRFQNPYPQSLPMQFCFQYLKI